MTKRKRIPLLVPYPTIGWSEVMVPNPKSRKSHARKSKNRKAVGR